MIVLGIDPGKTGALALHNGRLMRVEDMPVSGKDIDAAILADLLEEMLQGRERPDRVMLERQQAFPLEGRTTCFASGLRYGLIIGICACLDWPVEIVTPATWKRATKTPPDKDAARARASALMPEGASFWKRKKDHGRAEAALLAWWGAQQQGMAA
jgi:crossover junction endodeoxyribonuclease RuvC